MDRQILLSEILEEIKVYDTYELLDFVEFGENIYITMLSDWKGERIVIHFDDLENNVNGQGYTCLEELEKMSQNDFENYLNHVYYYNCDNPIED